MLFVYGNGSKRKQKKKSITDADTADDIVTGLIVLQLFRKITVTEFLYSQQECSGSPRYVDFNGKTSFLKYIITRFQRQTYVSVH